MPMKIVPFSEIEEGRWTGKFGRYEVSIGRRIGNTYWRGPDNEVVLETAGECFPYSIKGSHSGVAYTLAGAMEKAERDCRGLSRDHAASDSLRYEMTDEQKAAEMSAHEGTMSEAVEADRIAHSRGWELAIDVLPELKAFAERKGLYPFADHSPAPGC